MIYAAPELIARLCRLQDLPVYRWSTDQVDPGDRFDYWREVRAKGLFGVTAELEPEHRQNFFGEFSLRKFDGAGLIELRASPYRVERSTADIADAPGGSLCIYQQLGGGGWFGVNGSGDFTIESGKFATSHTDLPYNTAPLAADGYHLRILKIPVGALPPVKAGIGDLVPKPFREDASLAPLLQSCFSDLTEAGDGDPAMTTPLVQALAQFALIDRGVVRPASRAAMAAIRVGHLSLARRLIARHLPHAGLSPAFAADLLGISVRHLHGLFEATGTSFSQAVTAQRMKQSRRLLIESPPRPVSRIALACGFESLATFYRTFQAAHGMAPGEFRARGRAGEKRGPRDALYLKAK
jgi:AraC-like DNA-binding protein